MQCYFFGSIGLQGIIPYQKNVSLFIIKKIEPNLSCNEAKPFNYSGR